MNPLHPTTTSDSAMTEIALALSMAFFSILVLTMVSMGSGGPRPTAQTQPQTALPDPGLVVAAPFVASVMPGTAGASEVSANDRFIAFFNGSFYDSSLRPLVPGTFARDGRVILAVPTSLSVVEVLQVREQVAARDLVVTTLDDKWLERLGSLER